MKKYFLFSLLIILTIVPITTLATTLQEDILSNAQNVEATALGVANNETATPQDIVVNIIKISLSILGLLFVILIIWSGFQWMASGGNSETISKAKKRIINATIGLVIVLAAFAITEFVLDKIIMVVE